MGTKSGYFTHSGDKDFPEKGTMVEFAFGRLNSLRELKAADAALKVEHAPFNHAEDAYSSHAQQ